MKKILCIIGLLLMVIVSYGYAEDWHFSSGQKTTSALIKTGVGNFSGIIIVTDGTWPVEMNIFDAISGAATGKRIIPSILVPSSENVMQILMPVNSVRFNNGLFVSMVCSSGTYGYTVFYK
ncbi:MAG TPA: hypothetical protein ACFYD4_03370 [Candidatus Wunengus sp. YC61]|uniref:hypothetical protein n=1 Tax=Candidatus Wunengus sp. YC61 TaxID=3367698 RepID=UPI004029F2AB